MDLLEELSYVRRIQGFMAGLDKMTEKELLWTLSSLEGLVYKFPKQKARTASEIRKVVARLTSLARP